MFRKIVQIHLLSLVLGAIIFSETQIGMCLLSCDEAAEKAHDIRLGWVDELQFGTSRESEISVLTLMDPQGGVKINRRAKSLSWVQFTHTPQMY